LKRGKTPIHVEVGAWSESNTKEEEWRLWGVELLRCWIAFRNRFFFIPTKTLILNLSYYSLLSLDSPVRFLPKTTPNSPTHKAFSTPVASPLSASSYLMVHCCDACPLFSVLHWFTILVDICFMFCHPLI